MNNIKQIEIGSIKSKLGTGTTISTPIFSSNYKGLLKPIHWNQINCDDEFVLRTFEGNELYWQDSNRIPVKCAVGVLYRPFVGNNDYETFRDVTTFLKNNSKTDIKIDTSKSAFVEYTKKPNALTNLGMTLDEKYYCGLEKDVGDCTIRLNKMHHLPQISSEGLAYWEPNSIQKAAFWKNSLLGTSIDSLAIIGMAAKNIPLESLFPSIYLTASLSMGAYKLFRGRSASSISLALGSLITPTLHKRYLEKISRDPDHIINNVLSKLDLTMELTDLNEEILLDKTNRGNLRQLGYLDDLFHSTPTLKGFSVTHVDTNEQKVMEFFEEIVDNDLVSPRKVDAHI